MRSFRLVVPLFLLAVATQALGAQGSRGPTVARASVGVRVARAAPAKTPPRFAETRQNKALMVVGAAALIVGAVMDNTAGNVIMTGGAVTGLYGPYKYLE